MWSCCSESEYESISEYINKADKRKWPIGHWKWIQSSGREKEKLRETQPSVISMDIRVATIDKRIKTGRKHIQRIHIVEHWLFTNILFIY